MGKSKAIAIGIVTVSVVGVLLAYLVTSFALNLPLAYYSDERVLFSKSQTLSPSGNLEISFRQPIYRINNIVSLQHFVELKNGGNIEYADGESGIRSSTGDRVQLGVVGIAEDGRPFPCVPSGWKPDQVSMEFTDLPVGLRLSKLVIESPDVKGLNRLVWHEAPPK